MAKQINFRFIDHILALTGGGPADSTKLLPVYLFDVSFKFFKLGRGGAVAFTLLIVTIILGLILVRIFEDPARKKAMSSNNDQVKKWLLEKLQHTKQVLF